MTLYLNNLSFSFNEILTSLFYSTYHISVSFLSDIFKIRGELVDVFLQFAASAEFLSPDFFFHLLNFCFIFLWFELWDYFLFFLSFFFFFFFVGWGPYEIFLVVQMVKCLSTMQETWVQSLGWEDLLEKEMVTHSSILAWKIPWTEDPGRLQSMGPQSQTRLSDFTFFLWKSLRLVFISVALKHPDNSWKYYVSWINFYLEFLSLRSPEL